MVIVEHRLPPSGFGERQKQGHIILNLKRLTLTPRTGQAIVGTVSPSAAYETYGYGL